VEIMIIFSFSCFGDHRGVLLDKLGPSRLSSVGPRLGLHDAEFSIR